MKFTWFLLIFSAVLPEGIFGNECYVTPCTRDVILVVDGSSSMQTSTYVSQEINMITKLTYSWTLDESKVRLALVGAYFGNEFNGMDYFTDSSTVEKRLQSFRLAAMQYGLFNGDFNTTVRFLDERYVGPRANYGPREGVQKRILIFTSHSDVTDVASTRGKLEEFGTLGYAVTIIGIGVSESVYKNTYYHKFVSVQIFELGVVAQSIMDTITDEGICFLDQGWTTPKPQICTTSTTTTRAPTTTTKKGVTDKTATTTKAPRPTQPTFPVGDYQNCSCTTQNLYIDIVFVVDTSVGMGAGGLMMIKAEINTLVGQMSLDPDMQKHVQVGLIKYSKSAEIVFKPTDYQDEDEFTEDLWTNPALADVDEDEDEVNLHLGLREAAKMLGAMRKGVRKVVVVYAASYSNEGQDDARQIAASIRESGFEIITVAFVEPESTDFVMQIGEIASPRMNFTSFRDDLLVDELEDAFCQVNCYCPNEWKQLILENRKYGECFFATKLDASWTATKYECPILSNGHSGGNGHLVYVNSRLKNEFLNTFYMNNWDPENQETPNYDIGYYYDKTTAKYVWVNGVTNNPYANWADGHPKVDVGECVAAVQVDGDNFKWQSINCVTESGRGLCQEASCDSDFYCPPETN